MLSNKGMFADFIDFGKAYNRVDREYYGVDIVEVRCYVVITSESILISKYVVAESINQTTDCRMFRPLRPSSTAISCLIDLFCYIFAHQDRLANYAVVWRE